MRSLYPVPRACAARCWPRSASASRQASHALVQCRSNSTARARTGLPVQSPRARPPAIASTSPRAEPPRLRPPTLALPRAPTASRSRTKSQQHPHPRACAVEYLATSQHAWHTCAAPLHGNLGTAISQPPSSRPAANARDLTRESAKRLQTTHLPL